MDQMDQMGPPLQATAEHLMANQSLSQAPSITQNTIANTGAHGQNGFENEFGNGNGGFGDYQPGRRDLTVNDIADIADIDDPILLLETLTRWDSRNINSTYASTRNNSQISGSLQAAEMARASDTMRRSTPSSNNGQITRGSPARTSSKRRREGSEDAAEEGGEMFGFINAKAKPRKVRKLTAEEEEEAAREREIWGSEPSDIEDDEEGEDSHSKYSQIPDLNPRAHGVHSAAAIFRKTTAASRKYARPAMSSLFSKLEISPEEFITLQAAAKDYMLDPKHPDRSACVGSKGKRDSDMTKLQLYACAQFFLSDEGEGWGEKLFGKNSPSGQTRKFVWPQMPNRIISRITPLLRRMVTNERQRLYALNLRVQRRREEEVFQLHGASMKRNQTSASTTIDRIDPSLNSPVRNGITNPMTNNTIGNGVPKTQTTNTPVNASANTPITTPAITPISASVNSPEVTPRQPAPLEYHINILHHGKRIKDMFSLNPTNCVGFVSFTAHVDAAVKAPYKKTVMKVLGPNGLAEVKSEATYAMALLSVRRAEWMDGDVKIIVETEKTQ